MQTEEVIIHYLLFFVIGLNGTQKKTSLKKILCFIFHKFHFFFLSININLISKPK